MAEKLPDIGWMVIVCFGSLLCMILAAALVVLLAKMILSA